MGPSSTARKAIKAWLQGETPSRPLLMPFVFSLAAKLESLPRREFLSNPTKICNGLRQIHTYLHLDGVCCYYDPFLEAEALGCHLEWNGDEARLPRPSHKQEVVLSNLGSPDTIPANGRLPIACEVFRRLKVMLANGPALMARVTGPHTLAAQLFHDPTDAPDRIASCAEAGMVVARSLLEAGADAVFISEASLPEMTLSECETYTHFLEPIVNVVRFYGAMPVLQLGSADDRTLGALASLDLQCVLCSSPASMSRLEIQNPIGLAIPAAVWCGAAECFGAGPDASMRSQAVLLTSEGDLNAVDLKSFAKELSTLRAT